MIGGLFPPPGLSDVVHMPVSSVAHIYCSRISLQYFMIFLLLNLYLVIHQRRDRRIHQSGHGILTLRTHAGQIFRVSARSPDLTCMSRFVCSCSAWLALILRLSSPRIADCLTRAFSPAWVSSRFESFLLPVSSRDGSIVSVPSLCQQSRVFHRGKDGATTFNFKAQAQEFAPDAVNRD